MALPKFSQKAGERIKKGGERKSLNFGNGIAEIPLPNFPARILCVRVWSAFKIKKKKAMAAMSLPK